MLVDTDSSKGKPVVLAVIGGSGFYEFPELQDVADLRVDTPYGDVFGIRRGRLNGQSVFFLSRHGMGHRLPPHKINYRANLWALRQLGVTKIISINAVGSVNHAMPPGAIVLPEQIIDYTYGREHTYADLISEEFNHIDFTYPFDRALQKNLAHELSLTDANWHLGGVYGCVQGPRLETAAEVNRLERDGCDLIGMTMMPEAALARELGLSYASVCSVANWAAGRSTDALSFSEITATLQGSVLVIRQLLESVAPVISKDTSSQTESVSL